MISYPHINPVFLKIGGLELRWYGLMYILGITLAFWGLKTRMMAKLTLTVDQLFSLMTSVMVGVIVGGRLGYILIYDLGYYLKNPFEILAYWHGGMSYHGGALGAVIAVGFFCRTHSIGFRSVVDYLGLGSTVGLFLGRIGNFINGELYGRVSTVPWAMIFPNGGPYPRHPSQLYEAGLEGLVLGMILFWIHTTIRLRRGQLFSLYLIGYGLARGVIEFFREPDAQLGLFFHLFSMGQFLCLAMIIAGGGLFLYFKTPHE